MGRIPNARETLKLPCGQKEFIFRFKGIRSVTGRQKAANPIYQILKEVNYQQGLER